MIQGYDCASLEIVNNQLNFDESKGLLAGRYVSAIEGMWGLLEYPTHDRSHAVIRLAVHLPHHQYIPFLEVNNNYLFSFLVYLL